jgi:hypothetical protein
LSFQAKRASPLLNLPEVHAADLLFCHGPQPKDAAPVTSPRRGANGAATVWRRRAAEAVGAATLLGPVDLRFRASAASAAAGLPRQQQREKQKAARHTRACDYRHLLLLLLFILSNLLCNEVDKHNSHHRGNPDVDPSAELIGVANVFLLWC